MRAYTKYLDLLKTESVNAGINMGGSTPPLPPALLNKKIPVFLNTEKIPAQILKLKTWIAKQAHATPDEVALMPGSTQAAFQVLAALTNPGDAIVLERPVYEPYVAAAKFLGLEIRRYQRSQDFARDLSILKAATRGAKVLLISNPHCPTGWMYSRAEVAALADLGLMVVVDEVFLPLWTRGEFSHGRGGRANVVVLSGLSKPTGLGPYRFGWTIAEKETAKTIQRMGYHMHVDIPAATVPVAQFAFKNWKKINAQLLKMASNNRKLVLNFAKEHPGMLSHDFERGFFAMLRVPPRFGRGSAFVEELLKAKIFLRDGAEFEMDEWVRFHVLFPKAAFTRAFAKIASYY